MATPKSLDRIELPRAVWARSRRPFRGHSLRIALGSTAVLLGLLLRPPWLGILIAAVGVGVALTVPRLVDWRLRAWERRIERADVDQARTLLRTLERRWWIATFAPHAWLALQRARLHLAVGEPQTAATDVGECARLVGDPEHPMLLGAQAHLWLLADDRRQAAKRLQQLEQCARLTARDRLDYGIVLLSEPGQHERARALLEQAHATLGDHPRVVAALALAHARLQNEDEALALYDALSSEHTDPLVAFLHKRARKALRPRLEERKRRTAAT